MLKKKFKAVYLLFFIIPVMYFLLAVSNRSKDPIERPDYLYFSAKSNEPASLKLLVGKDLLNAWSFNSEGYKFFDFSGDINDSAGLKLEINNLNSNDTVSFLSFNIFRKNELFSFYGNQLENLVCSNGNMILKEGVLNVIIQKANMPCTISFKASATWKNTATGKNFKIFIAFVFIILFFLIIILAPPVRYFIFTCMITASVLILSSYYKSDGIGKIKMSTISAVKRAEFYYNECPQFTHLKRSSTDSCNHTFSVPFDFKSNSFVRLDVENTSELKKLKIGVRLGLFSSTWDVKHISLEKLVINDMKVKDGNLYITGVDPFIALSTDYFINDIKWLILLEQHIFLFMSLLVFLVLLCLHFWLAPGIKIQFRAVYLLFLMLPLAYYLLYNGITKEKHKIHSDYLYFSVRSSKPAVISLFTGQDSVTSWSLNSAGFKMIDCVCRLNDTAGMVLKINNLSQNDTVSFLAMNFFRDNTLYTLYDKSYPYCATENAATINKNGVFSLVTGPPDKPVKFHIAKVADWQKMETATGAEKPVVFAFLVAFIVLLVLAPPARYFMVCWALTLLLLGLFSWLGDDIQDQVTICTSTPQRSVETYYSNTPVYNDIDNKFPSKSFKYYFRTQVELGKYHYIRCDVDDSLKQLNNLKIAVKTGLLSKAWNFDKIPPEKLVLNDVALDNGSFKICGNDPFFALTSTYFLNPIHRLVEIRYNAFLFIGLFIFILLVSIHKHASKLNSKLFFLSAFFLSLIWNGLLFSPFNSARVRLVTEKRDADTMPAFNTCSLKNYTQQLNAYLNDQVTGRNKIIPFNNYLYYKTFGRLLNNPNVYFGKDGWMFYIGANGRETYENREPVTLNELEQIKHIFEERRDWLKMRGIKLYILFPKMTQFIYEEKLGPGMYRHNKTSKLDQLTTYLKENSDLNIIDVEKPIMEAKKKTKAALYYKSSTHWNYYGAYYAYEAMINYISKDFPDIGAPIPFNEITWNCTTELKRDIDLIEMAALTGYLKGYELQPSHPDIYAGDTVEHNFPNGRPDFPALFIVNYKKQHPNMLMFRDSYAKHLFPYLTHHFNRSAYLWTNTFYREYVEEEKPDMVIWEMSERFIPFYVIYKNAPFEKVNFMSDSYKNTLLKAPYLTLRDLWSYRDTIR